jgi:hypothetical protein
MGEGAGLILVSGPPKGLTQLLPWQPGELPRSSGQMATAIGGIRRFVGRRGVAMF